MTRPINPGGVNRIRMAIAIGLVVNFVGFVYDWSWHALHLSMVPIPPSKLLTVHGGIYLGSIIIAVAVVAAFVRQTFRTTVEQGGLLMIAVGLVIEFAGDGTDMWAHGHGYERDLYHYLIHIGAALTVAGYLAIELFHLFGPVRVGGPTETARAETARAETNWAETDHAEAAAGPPTPR